MGTITFSPEAPANEAVHFAFGNFDFDLAPGKSFETDEPELLRGAEASSWLSVKIEAPAATEVVEPDLTDPHVNPAADHLSEWASQEAKSAAAKAEEAIQAENEGVQPEQPVDVTPTDTPVVPAPVVPNSISNDKSSRGATS